MSETTLDIDIITSWFSSSNLGVCIINKKTNFFLNENQIFKNFYEYLKHSQLSSTNDLILLFYENLPKSGTKPEWLSTSMILDINKQLKIQIYYDYRYISPTTLYFILKDYKEINTERNMDLSLWSFMKLHANDCLFLINPNGIVYQGNKVFDDIFSNNITLNKSIISYLNQKGINNTNIVDVLSNLQINDIKVFQMNRKDSDLIYHGSIIRYSTTNNGDIINRHIIVSIPTKVFNDGTNPPSGIVNASALRGMCTSESGSNNSSLTHTSLGSPSPYSGKSIYDSLSDGPILYGKIDIDATKLYDLYPINSQNDEIQLSEIVSLDIQEEIKKATHDVYNHDKNVIMKYLNISFPDRKECSICDLYLSSKNESSLIFFSLILSYNKTSFNNVITCSAGDPVVNILNPYFIINSQLVITNESEGVNKFFGNSLINLNFKDYFNLTDNESQKIKMHLSMTIFKQMHINVSKTVFNSSNHYHVKIIGVPSDAQHRVGICQIIQQPDPHIVDINKALLSVIDFPYAVIRKLSDDKYNIVECNTSFQSLSDATCGETINLKKEVEISNLYTLNNNENDSTWLLYDYANNNYLLYSADTPIKHPSYTSSDNEKLKRAMSRSFDRLPDYETIFFRYFNHDMNNISLIENRYIVNISINEKISLSDYITNYAQTKGNGYEIIDMEDIDVKKQIICLISIQLCDVNHCNVGLIDLSKQLSSKENKTINELKEECLGYKTLSDVIIRNSWTITMNQLDYTIKAVSQPAQSIIYANISEEFVSRIHPSYRNTFLTIISKINPDPVVAFDLPLLTINNEYSWMKCTFLCSDTDLLCLLGPNSVSPLSIPDEIYRKAFNMVGCCSIFLNPESRTIYSITLSEGDETNYSNTGIVLSSLKDTQESLYEVINKHLETTVSGKLQEYETTYNTIEGYEIPVRIYMKTFKPDYAFIVAIPIENEQTLKNDIEQIQENINIRNAYIKYINTICGRSISLINISTMLVITSTLKFDIALEGDMVNLTVKVDNDTKNIITEFRENSNTKQINKLLRFKTKKGRYYKATVLLTKIYHNDYCSMIIEQPEADEGGTFEMNAKLMPLLLTKLKVGYSRINFDNLELSFCSDMFKHSLGNSEGRKLDNYISQDSLNIFKEKVEKFKKTKQIQLLSDQFRLSFHIDKSAEEKPFEIMIGDECDNPNTNMFILFIRETSENRDLNKAINSQIKSKNRLQKTLIQVSYNLYCKMYTKTKTIFDCSPGLIELIGDTKTLPIPIKSQNEFNSKLKNLETLNLPISKFSFQVKSKKTNKIEFLILKAIDTSDPGIAQILITNDTEIIEIRKQLADVQKEAKSYLELKQRFSHFMSHELRNQATIITMGLDDLLLTKRYDDKTFQNMKIAGDALSNLLDDFKTIEGIEGDKILLTMSPFSIIELISDLQKSYIDRVESKNLKLIIEIREDAYPFRVIGDFEKISFVIRNFLNNAISHTETGDIRLYSMVIPPNNTEQNNTVCIKVGVRDSGCGISESKLIHIFDQYKFIKYIDINN